MSVFTYAAVVNTGLWVLEGWLGWLVWRGAVWLVLPMLLLPSLFYVEPYVGRSGSGHDPVEK